MTDSWQATPAELAISADSVDVWIISTQIKEARLLKYRNLLSEVELARAEKFALIAKRREFVVTRGLLRQLLMKATGLDASQLSLSYGEHGKPRLDGGAGGKNIAFNVSHSDGMALVALTSGNRLGIDLEKIRPEPDWRPLAKRFFSEAEFQALSECPEEKRIRSFFTCWTRKEALVKALGGGIARGLKDFDVSIDGDAESGLLNVRWQDETAAEWSLRNVPAPESHAAALAVDRPDVSVRLWRPPS